MSGHEDQDETLMEEGMPGPGAPMPLSALVVCVKSSFISYQRHR